jgi:DNA primase
VTFVNFREVTQNVSFKDVFDYYRLHYKERGDECVLLCPFHDDHEPSLKANTAKGAWQCFGCRKHGNVIHFAADMEGVEFRDAALFLQAMFMTDQGRVVDEETEESEEPPKPMKDKVGKNEKKASHKTKSNKSSKRSGYMQAVEDKLLELLEEDNESALIKWVKEELLASYRRGVEAGKQDAVKEVEV